MMRRILTLLLFILPLTSFLLRAQQVWTAGTVWEVEYTKESGGGTQIFTLEEAVKIEGTSYLPLTQTDPATATTRTLGYVRAERGDSLVYVRMKSGDGIFAEELLYDFTKSFEYGDVITYGTINGPQQMEVDPKAGTLEYYYDVLEAGDCLPVWQGLVYKLGFLEGPLCCFMPGFGLGVDIDPTDPDPGTSGPGEGGDNSGGDGDKPKSSNVSHTLFKRKGGGGYMIVPTPDGLRVTKLPAEPSVYYDLSGRALSHAPHSLYIYAGRKRIYDRHR